VNGTNGTHPGARLDLHQLAVKNGYPNPDENDHTCPGCGHPVSCEWKVILEVRRRAQAMVLASNRLEAKLSGAQPGRKRNVDFSVEEARELLTELGSFNKVAARLGVAKMTVRRALGAPLPPSALPEYQARRKAER